MNKERLYVGGILVSIAAVVILGAVQRELLITLGVFVAGVVGGGSLHGILGLASPAPRRATKTSNASSKVHGEVKWFRGNKGFGFIVPDEGGEDCFVHRSSIEGGETLSPGDRVEYFVITDAKGRVAADKVVKLTA